MRPFSTMRRVAAVVLAASAASGPAWGAGLRAYSQVATPAVHLSDLFDDLRGTPDRVLGQAPAPGERITVQAPQLAAIARDFAVDWRPASGAERAVLERAGARVPAAAIIAALRAALAPAGAAPDAELAMPGFETPLMPAGETVTPEVSQVTYDAASFRFTALLRLAPNDMPATVLRLSGQAMPVVRTAVLTHRLAPGATLAAGDVSMARLRGSLLHGSPAVEAAVLVGQVLRRDVPPGVALAAGDVARPMLVARGGNIRMTLDADGMALSAEGVALQAGGMGERVRVQNAVSHATMQAVVTGDGEVRVLPGAPAAYINLAAAP